MDNTVESPKSLWIDYTNYRGERSWREIQPVPDRSPMWYGHTQYHPEDQWLLDAVDVDKGQLRTFAVKDIHQWSSEKMVSFCGGMPPQPYEPQKLDWGWSEVPQEGQPVSSAMVPVKLWTIQSPDGRTFQGETLLAAARCAREATTTVPPAVALQRILAACAWTTEDEKELQDHVALVRKLNLPMMATVRLNLLGEIEASARKLMGYPS